MKLFVGSLLYLACLSTLCTAFVPGGFPVVPRFSSANFWSTSSPVQENVVPFPLYSYPSISTLKKLSSNAVVDKSRPWQGVHEGEACGFLLGSSTSSGRDAEKKRICVIADMENDPLAKALVPDLEERFYDIGDRCDHLFLRLDVVSPKAALERHDALYKASTLLFFCTSFSHPKYMIDILDDVYQRLEIASHNYTRVDYGAYPTQLVGISSIGTEQRLQFRNVMASLFGELDQLRQVEEALVNRVRRKLPWGVTRDYTLLKLGKIQEKVAEPFRIRAGDTLDGSTTKNAAIQTIVEAVAYQPLARNATFCIAGELPEGIDETNHQFWDIQFLNLEGPQLESYEDVGPADQYNDLLFFLQTWAADVERTQHGVTTPVHFTKGLAKRCVRPVVHQAGFRFLFVGTGFDVGIQKNEANDPTSTVYGYGGIEITVEKTENQRLRVRARRCNYGDGQVKRRQTEKAILGQLNDAIALWGKQVSSNSEV
eukprot:Nitzschia sp. Nitz4//scaffold23_size168460//55193//56730//NITZ4_002212-RA/size168460-snap-gene-0.154-mRNA-1//-1//CDS//3329543614//3415//frame0